MDVPGLGDALTLLAGGLVVGPILAFLFQTAPGLSGWFETLASSVKWWLIFGLSLGFPLLAQVVIQFVPADVIVALEPFWKSLALGFVAWAGSQGTYFLFKKLTEE